MSPDKPFISVVIPTYNRAHCLCDAIESVLAQTFTSYEIIVIDDGSTDNTKDALQPYLQKIRYLFQENKGVSAARNTAIRVAQGEWIAFLDSDDEWMPQKLDIQIMDLRQYPEAVLSCTNSFFLGQPGSGIIDCFVDCWSITKNYTHYVREPFFKSYAFTSTVLAKRQAIEEVDMFDEELTIFEDGDLFFRLSTKGGFVVNPLALVKAYRREEGSDLNLSVQFLRDKEKYLTNVIKACCKYDNLKLTTIQKHHASVKLSSCWFDLGIVHHNLKNRSLARSCFFACFQINPSRKNLVKLFLGLTGSLGINLIEKKRRENTVFRRSDYYQNV